MVTYGGIPPKSVEHNADVPEGHDFIANTEDDFYRAKKKRDDMAFFEIEGFGSIPHDAIKFFAVFSRFEFALMSAGYVGGDLGENAWASWDRFGAELHKSFLVDVQGDKTIEVLFQEPPRRLVKAGDGLCEFVDSPAAIDAAGVLLAVRTIRNNLFHGSKVHFTVRDKQLIAAGVQVLDHALKTSTLRTKTKRVSTAFAYADLGTP